MPSGSPGTLAGIFRSNMGSEELHSLRTNPIRMMKPTGSMPATAGCRNVQLDDCTWGMLADKTAPLAYGTTVEGLQKIQSIMDNLRKNPPMKFGNYDVTAVRDYLKDEIVDVKTGEKKPTGIPKSNVLYFELTEDAWLCVRPSGTEPKIKLYFGVVGKDLADADEKSEKLAVIVKDLLNQLG